MKAPAGKRRLARCSKKASSGMSPAHGDDAPARQGRETPAQIREIGHAAARQLKLRLRVEKGFAGAAGKELGLPCEESIPAIMLLRRVGGPILIDRPIRIARSCGVTVFDRRRRELLHAPLLRGREFERLTPHMGRRRPFSARMRSTPAAGSCRRLRPLQLQWRERRRSDCIHDHPLGA